MSEPQPASLTYRDAGLDLERSAEASHDVADRLLESQVAGVHEDAIRAERPRGQGHVGGHALVTGGPVPDSQDRDQGLSPRSG